MQWLWRSQHTHNCSHVTFKFSNKVTLITLATMGQMLICCKGCPLFSSQLCPSHFPKVAAPQTCSQGNMIQWEQCQIIQCSVVPWRGWTDHFWAPCGTTHWWRAKVDPHIIVLTTEAYQTTPIALQKGKCGQHLSKFILFTLAVKGKVTASPTCYLSHRTCNVKVTSLTWTCACCKGHNPSTPSHAYCIS